MSHSPGHLRFVTRNPFPDVYWRWRWIIIRINNSALRTAPWTWTWTPARATAINQTSIYRMSPEVRRRQRINLIQFQVPFRRKPFKASLCVISRLDRQATPPLHPLHPAPAPPPPIKSTSDTEIETRRGAISMGKRNSRRFSDCGWALDEFLFSSCANHVAVIRMGNWDLIEPVSQLMFMLMFYAAWKACLSSSSSPPTYPFGAAR